MTRTALICFVALIFLLLGLVTRGICPADRAYEKLWYRVLVHNTIFAITIVFVSSLSKIAGILITSIVVGFAAFTCGRALICGSLSAFLVALLEANAYIVAYIVANKEKHKIIFSFIMFMLLLTASLLETGVI